MFCLLKLQVLILVAYCELRVSAVPEFRQSRLTLAEPIPYYYYRNVNGNPGEYSYGYDVVDPLTGNGQYRTEERFSNGTVTGSYGYVDPNGTPHRYRYIADHKGYRLMTDPIQANLLKPSVIQQPRPINPTQKPSITWSRPRKPNKKKTKPFDSNRYNWNNFALPPSHYASLY